MKCFYGFRWFGKRGFTTWASGGSGRNFGEAGELCVFFDRTERSKWVARENLSAPCGCGGGERDCVTRKEALRLVGKEQLEELREWALLDREECL